MSDCPPSSGRCGCGIHEWRGYTAVIDEMQPILGSYCLLVRFRLREALFEAVATANGGSMGKAAEGKAGAADACYINADSNQTFAYPASCNFKASHITCRALHLLSEGKYG